MVEGVKHMRRKYIVGEDVELSRLEEAVLDMIMEQKEETGSRLPLKGYLDRIAVKGWLFAMPPVGRGFFKEHEEEIFDVVSSGGFERNIFAEMNKAPDRKDYYKQKPYGEERWLECVSPEDFEELITLTALRIIAGGLLMKELQDIEEEED